MNDLRINLLGPPEIRWKDQLIPINRRIPRTLLFYLASRGNYVGREQLLTLFWENSPTDVSRRRLREALSRIRSGIPDSSILITHADLVGLDHHKIDVDQNLFLELTDLIGNEPWISPLNQPLSEKTCQAMLKASCLWQGAHFLEGAGLASTSQIDEWQLQTNQWLTPLRTRINERLSDHFYASRELENSLKYAYKALESDKLNDGLHCKVIQILIDMGQIEDARGYYSYVTNLFQQELNTQPPPNLTSIYQQINNQNRTNNQIVIDEWNILSSLHTPFVGRHEEFNILQTSIQAGRSALISGESGIGKTRFVQEFCEHFAKQKRILVSACRQTEINLPFQPLIELLRNHVLSSEWDELPAVWAGTLTVLMPELVNINPALIPPDITHDPDQNRSRIFEAIRQVFLLLAQNKDLILFIDDAHWADEATLAAISYLVTRPPFDSQSALILALRPEELNKNLDNVFPSPEKSHRITEIKLARLNPTDISSLGRFVLGYSLEKEFINQLAHESGGNPFFILETLRILQDQGFYDTHSESSQLPMAKSVLSLIQHRINQLSPLALETIEYASVIGAEFSPELVSISSKLGLPEVAEAIEELIQRNFIEPVEKSQQGISYRFIHEKIREALLEGTNPIRLRLLNKQIAIAMEASIDSQPGSQAAVLARHFEVGGELPSAIKYWLLAGQWARKLFSTNEAEQIFSHIERLILEANAKVSGDLIHAFYAEWTEMAFETNDVESIQSQNKNLLSLGRNRSSSLLIGAAFDGLSDACLVNNEFEEGLAYSNQAISYINQTDNAFERANAYIHRGVFLYMLGRITEAIPSFEQALQLSQEEDSPQNANAAANAHYQLALTQILSGWPEQGLDHARRALSIAIHIGHNHNTVTAYTASSLARYYLADFSNADQDNKLGLELAKRIHADRMLGYLYAIQGFLRIAEGRMDAAYQSAQLASELGEDNQLEELISIGCRIRGDIYLRLGNSNKAAEIYQEGTGMGSRSFWGLDNLIRLGFAQIRSGKLEIGMHNLHRGIDIAHSGGLEIVSLIGNLFLCYAHASLGEWGQVRQIANSLKVQTQKRALRVIQVMNWINLGMLEMNSGNQDKAKAFLGRATKTAAQFNDPFLEIRSLMPLINVSRSNTSESQASIQRIHEITDRLEGNIQVVPLHSAFLEFRGILLAQL